MDCKIHNRQKTMICERCADSMCPTCAEYIDGSWFCPECAVAERRIAAGLEYHDSMAMGLGDSSHDDEAVEIDTGDF